jgi:hypothetical protein
MPECGRSDRCVAEDADLAESIVLQAYVQLPLLPADGCWVAPLKRFGDRELRLVESVPVSPAESALRVELFDRSTQIVVERVDCEEVEDAMVAFQDMASRGT